MYQNTKKVFFKSPFEKHHSKNCSSQESLIDAQMSGRNSNEKKKMFTVSKFGAVRPSLIMKDKAVTYQWRNPMSPPQPGGQSGHEQQWNMDLRGPGHREEHKYCDVLAKKRHNLNLSIKKPQANPNGGLFVKSHIKILIFSFWSLSCRC